MGQSIKVKSKKAVAKVSHAPPSYQTTHLSLTPTRHHLFLSLFFTTAAPHTERGSVMGGFSSGASGKWATLIKVPIRLHHQGRPAVPDLVTGPDHGSGHQVGPTHDTKSTKSA